MRQYLVFLVLLCPLLSYAQNVCQLGNVYEELECHERQITLLKPKINAAYRELVQLNLYGADKNFEASQKLWLQFVEKDCAFENVAANATQGGGLGMIMAACKHERYATRLKQMQRVIRELKEVKQSHQ